MFFIAWVKAMSEMQAMHAPIALLTHAPNDLTVLHSALAQMPAGFSQVSAVNLQALENDAQMADLLAQQLATARIVVLRVLGRLGSIPGFADLVRHAQSAGRHLIAISGTGEPDPELAAASYSPSPFTCFSTWCSSRWSTG